MYYGPVPSPRVPFVYVIYSKLDVDNKSASYHMFIIIIIFYVL